MQQTGGSTQCFSIEDEGARPRRARDGWAGPPKELAVVGPASLINLGRGGWAAPSPILVSQTSCAEEASTRMRSKLQTAVYLRLFFDNFLPISCNISPSLAFTQALKRGCHV